MVTIKTESLRNTCTSHLACVNCLFCLLFPSRFLREITFSVFLSIAILGCNPSNDSGEADKLGSLAKAFAQEAPIVHELPPILRDRQETFHHSFPVLNDTGKRIRVQRVTKSCSCATTRIAQLDLAPGSQTSLELDFNVAAHRGSKSYSCRLDFDDGRALNYIARVNVFRPVESEQDMLDIGSIDPDGLRATSLTIVSRARHGEEVPIITMAVADTKLLAIGTIDRGPIVVEEHLQVQRTVIKLSFGPCRAEELRQAALKVTSQRGREKQQELIVPVYWKLQTPVHAAPARAFFGLVRRTDPPTELKVLITRRDRSRLRILSSSSTVPSVSATSTNTAVDYQALVIVRLNPKGMQGVLHGFVELETDDPKAGVLRIPVAAFLDSPTSPTLQGEPK